MLVYFICQSVIAITSVAEIAMFLRCIFSWIDRFEDSPIHNFLTAITEPLIRPLRVLFAKKNWFMQSPLDMPFLFTYLIIIILASVASTVLSTVA